MKIPGTLCALAAAAHSATAFAAGDDSWKGWTVIRENHTDLSTAYDETEDRWRMTVDRGEFGDLDGQELTPNRTIILVTEAAIREVPDDRPEDFAFLGEPGDTYYLLPAQERENVIHLGFNGFGIESGVFQGSLGGEFHIELAEFAGAGDFFLFTAAAGQANIFMDTTRDGPPYGERQENAGGHSHQNWVFPDPGIHILHFRPYGTLQNGAETSGEPETFFFLVDPTPVEWWLLDTFRENATNPHASPGADCAGDGRPNLLAYALGYPPSEPADPFLPFPEIVEIGGERRLSLVFRAPEGADGRDDRSDVLYRVQVSTDLETWEDIAGDGNSAWTEIDPDEDGVRRMRAVDSEPLDAFSRRFIRLEVDLLPKETE